MSPGWDFSGLQLPWDPDREPLASFIEGQLRADQDGLEDSGTVLPDTEEAAERVGLPFSAGARDGVATYHLPQVTDPEAVDAVLVRLRRVLGDGGLAELPQLYEAMLDHPTLSWVDELAETLGQQPSPEASRVYGLGLLLAALSPDREPVKAGIALLGQLGLGEAELALLRLLACHDELTLFAAVAVASASDEPESELWAIARRVRGWGRIQTATRLLDSEDAEIRAWLLRDGFQNEVDDLYLAVPCAMAGDLRGALEQAEVDDRLLDASARLFTAVLREGGPMPGIEIWEDGPEALALWLALVSARQDLLGLAVPVAQAVLEADQRDPRPWSEADGVRLVALAGALLGRFEALPEA